MSMSGATTAAAPRGTAVASTILKAGFLVGCLDGVFALLVQFSAIREFAPVRLFQGIAMGLLGEDAYAGGAATALLGLLLHFIIAHAWAAAYVVAPGRSALLRSATRTGFGAVAVGAGFGAVVWLVMNFLVKPVGGIPPTPLASGMFTVMLGGHALVVGVPIVAVARSAPRP